MDELFDINKLREFMINEVMFTSEATKHLGITPQRLHQLVHSGKLTPVKASKAGNLYLKSDLDERLKEMLIFNQQPNLLEATRFGNDPKVIEEAINYFTLQKIMQFSDKKTKPVYDEISLYIDMSEPFHKNYDEVSRLLEIERFRLVNIYESVQESFNKLDDTDYIIKIAQDMYPSLLEKTDDAPLFLFMRGNPRLLQYPIVSVVGTRNPTPDGTTKASVLATLLGKNKIVVASGLAKGIDRAAHEGALKASNPTIAVIGTPLNQFYPKENAKLQEQIGKEGLIISQFPPSGTVQKWNFPARNAVMSGISLATVIIEAGETSGALIQANYAVKQKRLVFIPQSALNDTRLNWPKNYIKKEGASSFTKVDELIGKLESLSINFKESVIKNDSIRYESVGTTYVHRG